MEAPIISPQPRVWMLVYGLGKGDGRPADQGNEKEQGRFLLEKHR